MEDVKKVKYKYGMCVTGIINNDSILRNSGAKKNDDISDRNRSFWWLLFLSFYGIIDAYVDSHMEDFPNNLDNKNNNMENK